jgi:hypothetical protein
MSISQIDRKIHEEFPERNNKIFSDKRKKIKTYIFIAEEQNIKLINILMDQA